MRLRLLLLLGVDLEHSKGGIPRHLERALGSGSLLGVKRRPPPRSQADLLDGARDKGAETELWAIILALASYRTMLLLLPTSLQSSGPTPWYW